jgi:hypothetical protein
MADRPAVLARFDCQDSAKWLVPHRLGTWLGSIGYRVHEACAGRVVSSHAPGTRQSWFVALACPFIRGLTGRTGDGGEILTDRSPRLRGRPGHWRLGANMIIVSEPSAEATQPVRTARYTPTHHRISAARNDTHRYANTRPLRVHTEEVG